MIRRGEDWGISAPVPPEAEWVSSDREASRLVTGARRRGEPPPPIVLLGGDLARTLGGTGDQPRLRAGRGTRSEVDVGAVLLDGALHWFVAHLVARRRWWLGRALVVANAAFLGHWNVAPRAHPGDGRLDVLDGRLAAADRFRARRRLASGTHVPHPGIDERRVDAVQLELAPALDVRLDGELVGRSRNLSVRVEPGTLSVWV